MTRIRSSPYQLAKSTACAMPAPRCVRPTTSASGALTARTAATERTPDADWNAAGGATRYGALAPTPGGAAPADGSRIVTPSQAIADATRAVSRSVDLARDPWPRTRGPRALARLHRGAWRPALSRRRGVNRTGRRRIPPAPTKKRPTARAPGRTAESMRRPETRDRRPSSRSSSRTPS